MSELITATPTATALTIMARTVRTIVIIVAMEQEAEPFIQRHGLIENNPSPFEPGSPMVAYSGQIHPMTATTHNSDCVTNTTTIIGTTAVDVHLIWNGRCKIHNVNHVATTAAAVSTYASIAKFRPDVVISAGTAGGFGELGARIGDVYLSTKCVFHGRRIPHAIQPSSESRCSDSHVTLEEYGFGHFRSPPLGRLAAIAGVKQGVISSSDSLDCSVMDLQLLRSEGAVVKEMEAAAVAWVCQQLSVPFFALKSITDIVDGGRRTETEFYVNLERASLALQQKLSCVVSCLANTRLTEWGDLGVGGSNSSVGWRGDECAGPNSSSSAACGGGGGGGSNSGTDGNINMSVSSTNTSSSNNSNSTSTSNSNSTGNSNSSVSQMLLSVVVASLGVGVGLGLAMLLVERKRGR